MFSYSEYSYIKKICLKFSKFKIEDKNMKNIFIFKILYIFINIFIFLLKYFIKTILFSGKFK